MRVLFDSKNTVYGNGIDIVNKVFYHASRPTHVKGSVGELTGAHNQIHDND